VEFSAVMEPGEATSAGGQFTTVIGVEEKYSIVPAPDVKTTFVGDDCPWGVPHATMFICSAAIGARSSAVAFPPLASRDPMILIF
jgi:hypothetical protein